MIVTAEQLAPVQALYDRGLFVQAWQQVQATGLPPLAAWRGPEGRVFAGRLASRLGAVRLAHAIFDRARREAPQDARARTYWLHGVAAHRGVFVAWRRLHEQPMPAADGETQADLALLRAVLLAAFRDFAGARDALAQAEAAAPVSAWTLVQTAAVFTQQDRYDQALDSAQQALQLRPWFVPAVGQAAHLMQLLDRDGEACALLQEALAHVESFDTAVALAVLHEELGHYADALATIERVLALAPLAEPGLRQWAAARRCDLWLRLGDHAAAKAQAEIVGSPFHKALAARLSRPEVSTERVVLSVPFVRQHHMTCGPATLVAQAAFFGRAIDHLQVADEICYGGTSAANARRWAIKNGFVAREFTFNADDAQALLQRGVPIAVATAQATSGHLQAVVGFDVLRGTLIVRDPFTRNMPEWLTEEFLRAYRACGPRALVLLPQERASEIADLRLRDEALHDDDFAIQEALLAHDHAAASARYAHMLERDPEHMLTIQARWALSAYERDPVGTLACIERLLALFPDDQRLLLRKVWSLAELEQTQERVAVLDALTRRRGSDPVFFVMLAEERRARAFGAARARALLHRALRRQPSHAYAHHTLGMLAWQANNAPAAHEHLRFAACLDETADQYAADYFDWCRAHGQASRGLEFLQARHERWRRQAAGPTLVLRQALLDLHRPAEARSVLADALAVRPEDGNLLLAAAEQALRAGDLGLAETALHAAEGKAFETRRVAALADLADRAGDRERALRCWQSILQREPLNQPARSAVFELTETLRGRAAAVAELQAAASELPFIRSLRRYVAYQVGRDDIAAATALVRQIIDDDPTDAWAWRELALKLAAQGQLAQAIATAAEACSLDPERAAGHSIHGHLLLRAGQTAAARASLWAALDRDLDDVSAVHDLAELAADADARRALLQDLVTRLCSRGSTGPGLQAFARIAAASFPAAEVRGWLETVWRAQPDAQVTGSVLVEHLLDNDDVESARQIAERACERFPLHVRTWLDRAAVARGRDVEAECTALERAAKVAPDSAEVAWHLASAYVRAARPADARAVLERNCQRTRDPNVLTLLAEIHAEANEHAAAVRCAQAALQLDCEFDRAWLVLRAQAERSADPDLPERTARELARARPHDARVFMTLAHMLQAPAQFEERLTALARAIELDPGNPDPYDLRAELLAQANRHAAAQQVIAAFPQQPLPTNLRGRRAWLLHAAGDTEAAIAAMRSLLAEEPFYTWGWRMLAEWLHAGDRLAELRDVVEAYLRARPNDAVAYAWVGETSRLQSDRAAAKAAFARALRLDAKYAFAGERLFALQLEDGELDAADATLALCEHALQPAHQHLRHLQVACKKGDRERSRQRLLRLCREHADAAWALRAAGDALANAGLGADARDWLRADLQAPAEVSSGAVVWIRTWTSRRKWRAAIHALHAEDIDDHWFLHGASALIEDLTETRRARLGLGLLRGKAVARLHAFDQTWAHVGRCLNSAGRYRRTVRWMADWTRRQQVEAWMLVNLVYALRCLGRFPQAHVVTAAAAALPEQGAASAFHRVWLALDAFVAGDVAAVQAGLQQIDAAGVGDHERALFELLASLLTASQAAAGTRTRSLRQAFDAAWISARKRGDRALLHAVRHAARAERRRIGARAWWWALRYA